MENKTLLEVNRTEAELKEKCRELTNDLIKLKLAQVNHESASEDLIESTIETAKLVGTLQFIAWLIAA